jgi:phosphopantothenoylcysteine synthetase/decarboxylase
MNAADQPKQSTLYLITCAAQSSEPMYIQDFVRLAQAAAWNVYVIATPQATKFIDILLLEELTGHPVRSEYRHPAETDTTPKADAIVVTPTTFNTINKLAQGITDTLALGVLCGYMGLGVPIIAIPCLPESLACHPAFSKNTALLKECGVYILYDPQEYPPMNNVPWEVVLDTLHRVTTNYSLQREKEEVH